MTTVPEFDRFADSYGSALDEALAVSGEDRTYFATGRIAWLAVCLRHLKIEPESVLDYGCGIGSATPFFFDLIGAKKVLGTAISSKSLAIAKQSYGSETGQFLLFDQLNPSEQFDLAFCNGVFHHIPLPNHTAVGNYIYRSLRPSGLFAFWENNPWNPGTRYVMSRCVFDRDAIPLSAPKARSFFCSNGFRILRTDFLFIFPRKLRWFRPIEPFVSRLPLGAQYQILCQKP
jgi:SAM-dependent methyltransferase